MLNYTTKAVLKKYGYQWRMEKGTEIFSVQADTFSSFEIIDSLRKKWKLWLNSEKAVLEWHMKEEIIKEYFASGYDVEFSTEPQTNPLLYEGEEQAKIIIRSTDVIVIISVNRKKHGERG